MKKNTYKLTGQRGFSLLEIVISLIVSAFLGTILVTYLGTSLMKSAEPIIMIQQGYSLNQIMESMTADYKKILLLTEEDKNSLTEFENYVMNKPYAGNYTIQTKYITFNDGNENQEPDTDEKRILKVTITNNDLSLVALFSK